MALKAVAGRTNGGGGGGVAISAGANSASTGTVVFSNSNGVTFGMDGAGVVTASVNNTGGGGGVAISAGTNSTSTGTVVFSNSNGVSFGMDTNGVVTGTVGTNYAGTGFTSASTAGSNLVGTQGTNGLSVGVPNWLTTAMQSGASTQFVQANATIAGTSISGTIASNGMSLSVGPYITTARRSTDAVGLNSAQTNVTWTVNSSGISLNAAGYAGTGFTSTTTGGTAIVGTNNTAGLSLGVPAFITTARASSDAVGLNTAQTNVTWTVNSSGISLNAGGYAGTGFTSTTTGGTAIVGTNNTAGLSLGVPAFLTTAMQSNAATLSNIKVSAGTLSANRSDLTFSNANNVSFGLDTNGVITGSIAGAVVNSLFQAGVSTGGNTAGTTSVANLQMVLVGGNNITLSQSLDVLSKSGTVSIIGGGGGGGIAIANSQTTFSTNTVNLLEGGGAITIASSAGGQSFKFSVPQTSSLVGVSGVSVSTNGSTISVGLNSINQFEPMPLLQSGSTTYAPVAGSWYFQPFFIPMPLSGGRLNMMVAHGSTASNFRATTANFNSNSTGTLSLTGQYERRIGLFSVGGGTNSTRLESVWQSAFPMSYSHVVQVASAAGPNLTVTVGITVSALTSIGSDGGTTLSTFGGSTSSNSASSAMASNQVTALATSVNNLLSSQLMIPVPFNTTLGPGMYYMGMMFSSTVGTTSTGTNISTSAVNALSVVNQYAIRNNDANTGARAWLQTAASSGSIFNPGQGVWTATSASAPATVGFSDLRSVAGMPLNYVNYVNSTI